MCFIGKKKIGKIIHVKKITSLEGVTLHNDKSLNIDTNLYDLIVNKAIKATLNAPLYIKTLNNGAYVEATNLIASNIRSGVNILGVQGTFEGTYTGTKEITSNGSHNVAGYAYVNVNVPTESGGVEVSGTLAITENGTHNIASYEFVEVNVPTDSFSATGIKVEEGVVTIDNTTGGYQTIDISGQLSGTTINIEGGGAIVNLSYCEGDITLRDNFYNAHNIVATNLEQGNIKQGVTILGVTGTYEGTYGDISGVTTDGRYGLVIDNDTGAYQGIDISGQITGTTINVSGTGATINNEVNDSTIKVNGSGNTINIIDTDVLSARVQGDSASLELELTDSVIHFGDCQGEIILEDDQANDHTFTASNLKPEYIRNGVTILGVTGTYETIISGTKNITENGTHDVSDYANVYVNVPTGSVAGVTGNGSTLTIDGQSLVESAVYLQYHSGLTIDTSASNANLTFNLRGNNNTYNVLEGSCNGTHTLNVGGRTIEMNFNMGELTSIKVDGTEI